MRTALDTLSCCEKKGAKGEPQEHPAHTALLSSPRSPMLWCCSENSPPPRFLHHFLCAVDYQMQFLSDRAGTSILYPCIGFVSQIRNNDSRASVPFSKAGPGPKVGDSQLVLWTRMTSHPGLPGTHTSPFLEQHSDTESLVTQNHWSPSSCGVGKPCPCQPQVRVTGHLSLWRC